MNPFTLYSFASELEKIAITQAGAEAIQKETEESRKRGYSVIEGKKRKMKEVPVTTGIKRNIVATGRRLLNPKMALKRVKWSLTGPGVPAHMKALAGLGVAATAAHAIPKKDPSGEGKSRIHRALDGVGGLVGGTAGKGLTGGIVGGTVGAGLGSLAGKAIDKIRGYKPPED